MEPLVKLKPVPQYRIDFDAWKFAQQNGVVSAWPAPLKIMLLKSRDRKGAGRHMDYES